MKKINYYLEKCIEFIITHTVWSILTSVFSIILLNVPTLIKGFYSSLNWSNALTYIALSASVLSLIIFLISIVVFRKAFNKKSVKNTLHQETNNSTDPDTEEIINATAEKNIEQQMEIVNENPLITTINFKKITVSLEINSCSEIEYVMKFDGYSAIDSLECFEKTLSWSGSEYYSTILQSSNIEAELVDNEDKRCIPPYNFRISFNDDIEEGERVKFVTKTSLSDSKKCMIPMSLFCAKYPIDELILRVSVPIGLIHTVRRTCYRDTAREVQVYSSKRVEQEDAGGYRTYIYRIQKPHSWHYYALEWEFSEKY